SFTEVALRIPTKRMDPGNRPPKSDAGLRYMHDQLAGYEPKPHVYETVRLEGQSGQDTVHVHEVYWADLSRAGSTWYRLLAEFYQLILHLPSIGRNCLESAANRMNGAWTFAHALQSATVWLLTVPAVLLNVVLFSLGAIPLAAEIPAQYQRLAAIALAAAIAIAVCVLPLRKKPKLLWALWLPIVLAMSAASYFGLSALFALEAGYVYTALALEALLLSSAACIFIAYKYNVMKETALTFGILATLATAVIAGTFIIGEVRNEATAYIAAVDTAQRIYLPLAGIWMLIFAFAIAAAIAGLWAVWRTPKGERVAAYRATWTARFSLAMPTVLFAIVTLALWYLVTNLIGEMSPGSDATLEPWRPAFFLVPDPPHGFQSVAALMEKLLLTSARGLEFLVGALAIFIGAGLFAALPSILVELRHPSSSTDDESTRLGDWLTRGIVCVGLVAEVFTVALAVLLAIGFTTIELLSPDQLGMLVAAAAALVGLLLTGKRFIKIFRAAVDVLLDVDNYLRESPKDAAPRARIAERFVSLLRHLAREQYDSVVIVAHSQGTVIAADVLRYLTHAPDPALANVKIFLYTMGSPLRQLYAQAFPYLYDWIVSPDAAPDATKLGVLQWANVYCSGDYVGRNVWSSRIWIRKQPVPPAFDANGNPLPQVDFCAGAGAHTHYWTGDAEDVAAYLRQVV
ncbi:MAG: hypothetical protein ACLGH0_10855, partial [Thermoanaerobaculia bacterium]